MLALVLVFFGLNGFPELCGLFLEHLNKSGIVLFVLEVDQFVLFFGLGVGELRLDVLQLSVHLLEVLIHVLHLPLLLSHFLFKFYQPCEQDPPQEREDSKQRQQRKAGLT
jgi:hypothetical protein